jgi:magnesium transporter
VRRVDMQPIYATIYKSGKAIAQTDVLTEAYRAIADDADAMAWIELASPSSEQVNSLAENFSLHELVVEDAIVGHQRPKLERYGRNLLAVVHAARYLEDEEEVQFGELHLILGPGYVSTIRHKNAPEMSWVRARLERNPEVLALGPEAVLYGVIDAVVDEYVPVVRGLERDVDEIEIAVFSRQGEVSQRIYELSREVADFQRAIRALRSMLGDLNAGFEKS